MSRQDEEFEHRVKSRLERMLENVEWKLDEILDRLPPRPAPPTYFPPLAIVVTPVTKP